jgi:eukaryotic-like serine/threonine-protein kinase
MDPVGSMGRLGDRFVLVREIGTGGKSRVFLGRDEVLDRPVAVKIVEPDPDDPEVGLRFQREGRSAARLSHPNIVRVFDAGEDELYGRAVSYIVTEYVPGGDFEDLIDRNGPLPETMLLRIGAAVASGLAHAHEHGIIHGDVKPRNVLMDERGSPKLGDIGIASALDRTTSHYRGGSYLGTVSYFSPEQLRGEKVSPKTDIYSFGVTLYRAAVGKRPFFGNSRDVANQHILAAPTPPRERGARISEGLETLILDCLAKDPDRRPDATRLRDRLLQGGATAAIARPVTRTVGAASLPDTAGTSRQTGTAGTSGVGVFRRRPDHKNTSSGLSESTISLPTRTFRAGSRQRTMLAALVAALLLLLLIVAGAWALLGLEEQGSGIPGQGAGRNEQAAGGGPQKSKEEPGQGAGGEVQNPSGGPGSSDGAQKEDQAPAPPLSEAERVVFNLYYQESFNRVDASWEYLSERLQNEIGSPERWAEREDIYTFTYMEFTSLPVARAVGDTAEVTFEVRLDHTWGSESRSGTWICVNEGGEWKLDRLENAQTVRV